MSANGWIVKARVATYDVAHRDGGAPFAPGCFAESLGFRKAPLPLLFQHDARQPLGVAVDYADGDHALDLAFHVPRSPRGSQAVELMNVMGESAEFSVTHLRRCGPGYLTRSELTEVSFVVPRGFVPGTRLLGIERLDGRRPPVALGHHD